MTRPAHTSDVLVVGGGIAGLATAAALARAGLACTLLEAAPAFGAHSTAQNAAILRTLLEAPELTQIGRASARSIFDPPAEFQGALVDSSGLLLTADPEDTAELLSWAARDGSPAHSPIEILDAAQARALAPHLAPGLSSGGAALHLPREGVLDIARMVTGFERQARHGRRPATLRTGARATGFERAAGRWTVELASGERLVAEQLVLTGGAWAEDLARALGSPQRFAPRRRHLAVLTKGEPVPALPVVWNHSRRGNVFYTRPEVPGLLVCACDEALVPPTAPPDAERCPRDPDVLLAVAETAASHLPAWADAQVHSWWAGWRTFDAVDGHRFVIGPDAAVDGLYWAAGLGGHGMTASFEVGRLAAAAVAADRGSVPAELAGESYGGAFTPGAPSAHAS